VLSRVQRRKLIAVTCAGPPHPLVTPGRQPTAIVNRETHPTSTKLTPQEVVLFDHVGDALLLTAVPPIGQRHQHHVKAQPE
jgi:hypothetical protein